MTLNTALKTIILDLVKRSGPITFERYMALCLYHPEHGYYMQGRERTGVRGDYFTSPDLHPIFARLIARQAAEMWEALRRPAPFTWVEMGAGRGWFARDFLLWVKSARPDFGGALDYVIVEPSLASALTRLNADGLDTAVRALESLEAMDPVVGCFFSNELVDAFPVHVVMRHNGRLQEMYVTAEGGSLRETTGPISDSAVAAAVARYAGELDEGHRVEVNLAALPWMRAVAETLARGFVITIDYGDLAERLYTPARSRGTLLAYQGHTATESFVAAPGEQDLTAHVNFSALMDAGRTAGLEITGFTTQERFLLALGEATEFTDLYDPGQTEAQRLDARLKLKRLIFPGEGGGTGGTAGMGGAFKVLVQHRGTLQPQLTGLKYQRLSRARS